MRKKLFVMVALVLGTFVSMTLTSCGGDDEPTPQQEEQDDNGNGGNNNDNGGGQQSDEDKSGEIDGHIYVDLGLPSGTLWANMNVGASKPEGYGGYFAWGETVPYGEEDPTNATNYAYAGTYTKTSYTWSTYKYCNGSKTTLTKYCNDSSQGYNGFTDTLTELTSEDDAATVNWGSAWRMPTEEQLRELINSDYTTTVWTTQGGVNGYLITSKMPGHTDNSIFLPAAGYRYGGGVGSFESVEGKRGEYWSRTLFTSYPCKAIYLCSYSGFIGLTGTLESSRRMGRSIRPVRVSQ